MQENTRFACSCPDQCCELYICKKYHFLPILQTPSILSNNFNKDNYTGAAWDDFVPVIQIWKQLTSGCVVLCVNFLLYVAYRS